MEPKVTRPIFYLKNEHASETNDHLRAYYASLRQFVSRMKIDNEDETNYKIDVVEFALESYKNEGKGSEMEEEFSQVVGSS